MHQLPLVVVGGLLLGITSQAFPACLAPGPSLLLWSEKHLQAESQVFAVRSHRQEGRDSVGCKCYH